MGSPLLGQGSGLGLDPRFGVASLEAQTARERAYAPLPQPSGELIHDPDFVLPTTAGPLPWRLFQYSASPDVEGPFGYGRRASWPMRLCADVTGSTPTGYIVTVNMEREDGVSVQYLGSTGAGVGFPTTFTANSPRLFDTLVATTQMWEETRFDTGALFHYPAGTFCSLSYFKTALGQTVSFHYDATSAALTTIQEPAGRSISYGYSGSHVGTVQDWAGRVHTLLYDGADNLQSIQDPTGAITQFGYDGLHRLVQIVDPNHFSSFYAYDDQDRVVSRQIADNPPGLYAYSGSDTGYTDPLGGIWTTTLDGQGNVNRAIDPVGAIRSAVYSAKGLPLVLQSALAIPPTTVAYDTNGRETAVTNPMGQTVTRTWDPYGNLLTEMDPLGRISTLSYYGSGGTQGQTRQLLTLQNPNAEVVTHTYNAVGFLQGIQTPLGYRATYNWNSLGTLDTSVDFLGFVRSFQYDGAGNPIVVTDELGRSVTAIYDGVGQLLAARSAVGAVASWIYDGIGNVQVAVDPLGCRTTFQFNEFSLPISLQDAKGNLWQTYYDVKGRPVASLDPLLNAANLRYDSADRLIATVDPLGRSATVNYDLARRPVSVLDPAGLLHTTNYDNASRRIGALAPDGTRVTWNFDSAGQLRATVDPAGLNHTMIYDRAGRPQAAQEPTGAIITASYDANGRWVGSVDALANRVTMQYDLVLSQTVLIDPLGRRHTTLYDGSGALFKLSAPAGTSLQPLYDIAGRAYASVDQLGLRVTLGLDLAGQVLSVMNPLGVMVTASYDPIGLPVAHTDILGNRFTVGFDAAARPVDFQDPLNNIAHRVYDASGAVIALVDALGRRVTQNYDFAGRLSSTIDARAYRMTALYDSVGRGSATLDQDGYLTTQLYDSAGRPDRVQDARNGIWATHFDPATGRVLGGADPLNNAFTLTLDLLDRPVAVVNALGYRNTVSYNPLDQALAHQDASGFTTTLSYDSRANLCAVTNARGYVSTALYDQYSRPVASQDARGFNRTVLYDPFGRDQAFINARGYCTTPVYDSIGRYVATVDPQGFRTSVLYDQVNRPVASQDAEGYRVTAAFDELWRVRSEINHYGYVSTWNFDERGLLQSTLNAAAQVVTFAYSGRGLHVGTQYVTGCRTSHGYDAVGNRTADIDGLGHTVSYLFDARNLYTGHISPLGYSDAFTLDGVGQRVTYLDANGQATNYRFSGRGEMLGQDNPRMTWSYDPVGNRVQAQDGLGIYTFAFDATDELISELPPLAPGATPFVHGYDGNRNLTSTSTLYGSTTYGYDSRDELVTVRDPGYAASSISGGITSFGYTARGQTASELFPNGTKATHVYDADGLPLQLLHSRSDNTTIAMAANTWDPIGRLLVKSLTFGVRSYLYDPYNQLVQESSQAGITTWLYDFGMRRIGEISGGQRITYTLDANDRLVQAVSATGTALHSYDANGNKISILAPSGSIQTFNWDAMDRLVGARLPAGSRFTLAYQYDGLMATKQGPQGIQTFAWDGDACFYERQGAGIQLYSHGGELLRAVGAKTDTTALNRQYHLDTQGNVLAITDGSQALVATFSFDAFGDDMTGAAPENNYDFLGGLGYWHDPDLGFYYVRARWLDTETGSWLSEDPVRGEPGYAYGHNSPTLYTDPSGRNVIGRRVTARDVGHTNAKTTAKGSVKRPSTPPSRSGKGGGTHVKTHRRRGHWVLHPHAGHPVASRPNARLPHTGGSGDIHRETPQPGAPSHGANVAPSIPAPGSVASPPHAFHPHYTAAQFDEMRRQAARGEGADFRENDRQLGNIWQAAGRGFLTGLVATGNQLLLGIPSALGLTKGFEHDLLWQESNTLAATGWIALSLPFGLARGGLQLAGRAVPMGVIEGVHAYQTGGVLWGGGQGAFNIVAHHGGNLGDWLGVGFSIIPALKVYRGLRAGQGFSAFTAPIFELGPGARAEPPAGSMSSVSRSAPLRNGYGFFGPNRATYDTVRRYVGELPRPPAPPTGSSAKLTLIHLTNDVGETGINASGKIGGQWGIFAMTKDQVPRSRFSRLMTSWLTGVKPSNTREIEISGEALEHFNRPPIFGVYSTMRRILGVRSTPLGSVNIKTGEFMANEIFKGGKFASAGTDEIKYYLAHQALLDYGVDSLIYGGGGLLGYGIYRNWQAEREMEQMSKESMPFPPLRRRRGFNR